MMTGARRKGLPLIFGLLLLLLMAGFPAVSHAAATDDDPCAAGENSPVDQAVRSLSAKVAQDITRAELKLLQTWGAIDVRKNQCFDQLKGFFQALLDLRWDLNIFEMLMNRIQDVVIQILNNLCSQVLGTLKDLEDSLVSQFNRLCIPLPDLSLNLNMPQFSQYECAGNPTITVKEAPARRVWDKYVPDNVIKER